MFSVLNEKQISGPVFWNLAWQRSLHKEGIILRLPRMFSFSQITLHTLTRIKSNTFRFYPEHNENLREIWDLICFPRISWTILRNFP